MLKRSIVLAGPGAIAAAGAAAVLARAGGLPDPLATHWGPGGAPDGHAPAWAFFGGVALACALAWGFLLLHARCRPDGLRLTAAPAVWATAALLAGVAATTAWANAGAASWQAACDVGLADVGLVLLAAALAGVVAWALERGRPVAAQPAAEAAPAPVALADGEHAVWTRSLASRPAVAGCLLVGGGLVAGGLLTGGAAGWWLVFGGLLAAGALSALTEIVATVDRRGLTIAYGPLGWPRQSVPLADVARAERAEIDPWSVGGWGYRKVPRRPGATAVVLRGGEGLRVVRRDGRELLVTVPDAATAAGLLNALRGRAE